MIKIPYGILRVTPDDIKELKEIVDIEPEATQDYSFNIEHEITGNQTMKKFQQLLMPVFAYVYQSGLLRKPITRHQFVSHKQLVHIIESGTAEMLRNGMRNHLENQFARL